MMKKITIRSLVASVALGLVATIAQADPLKLAHSTWVGYGPLYIAQEKGFFKEEGVDVELIVMENTSLKMGALMAGRIDVVASTADEFPVYMKPGKPIQYIFAVDNSKGGDGVLALNSIKSVADLKGKQVAFEEGSVSQFFINALLREAGLKQDDIEVINMTATDAGVAFTAKRVDAAVTWEPHLSQGAAKEHGHVLVDSEQRSGLIVDVVAVLSDTANQRRDELKALWRGWNRALAYLEKHPEESYKLMSKGVGGWLNDPAVFAETLGGIEYLDESANRALFGQSDDQGQLYTTLGYALEIWRDFGKLQVDLKPADIINHSFIDG